MSASTSAQRRGLWIAAASFVLWGLMPLYWHLLKTVPSLQIVAHRVVWSALLVAAWLAWKQGRGWLRAALARPRVVWMLALSAALIGFNWSLYIWAVNAGHVIETSLGYFINPLVNVFLGVLLLDERLNRVRWLSVGLAAAGVLWLTLQYGQLPWIALALALSFALYGLVRKLMAIDAVAGLGVESVYLLLPAVALLLWGGTHGDGGFLAFLPETPPPLHGVAALILNPSVLGGYERAAAWARLARREGREAVVSAAFPSAVGLALDAAFAAALLPDGVHGLGTHPSPSPRTSPARPSP